MQKHACSYTFLTRYFGPCFQNHVEPSLNLLRAGFRIVSWKSCLQLFKEVITLSIASIKGLLGPSFSNLSIRHFFLLPKQALFRKGILCIPYSLYTWRNTFRHHPHVHFTRRGLIRFFIRTSAHDMRISKDDRLKFLRQGTLSFQ